MKTCRGCGSTKILECFYKHSRLRDGRLNHCTECVRTKVREHRKDHPRDSGNREKRRAQWAVYDALRKGKLHKPDECSRCGRGGRIEGHHEDYSQPLAVIWLCSFCHSETKFG